MNKQLKRVLAFVLAFMLGIAMTATASAATKSQSGLQFELKTDKESYKAGESIQFILNVLNTNEQELTVSYDIILPDNLQLAADEDVVVVGSGEQASSRFTVKAFRGAEELPSTGDNFPMVLAILLFAAAGVMLIVLCAKKKQFMMFIIVLVLLFGMVEPAMFQPAFADEAEEEEEIAVVYEEDAYQQEFLDEPSEESMELVWDEAEQKALASFDDEEAMIVSELYDELTLEKNIVVDGKVVPVQVNVVITNDVQVEETAEKATLGSTKLKSIKILGPTKFRLNWNAVPGATHYEVWHSWGSGYIKKTTTTALTYATNYGKQGLINTYKVRAIVKSGNTITKRGPYSTRTCYGMATPTLSSVGHTSSSSADVRIRWKAGSFCTGYYVYRSFTGEAGTYKLIGSSTGLSFVDKYRNGYYKIRPYYSAKNGITYSGPATSYKAMPAQYRALVIGQSYPNWSSGRLPGCLNDAQGMKNMLGSMTSPKYRPWDVKLRKNLTAAGILQEIKSCFQRAKANDVSVFYYSGHGVEYTGDLCGVDQGGYVSVNQLRTALDAIPGKKIVILDSCYSGRYINKSGGKDIQFVSDKEAAASFNNAVIAAFSSSEKANLATSNYYVITACSKYQTSTEASFSNSGKRVGIFTAMLLEGCGYDEEYDTFYSKMYADTNNNKDLTLHEVYTYADRQVSYYGFAQDAQVYPVNSSFVLWGK